MTDLRKARTTPHHGGLFAMSIPQASDRMRRNTQRLCHRAAGPVGRFTRIGPADQCTRFRDGLERRRGPARLSRLAVKETIYPLLAISLSPTPDGGATDTGPPHDSQHPQSFRRMEVNHRSLHALQWAIAINQVGAQSRPIFGTQKNIDRLSHQAKCARLAQNVTPMIVSVHDRHAIASRGGQMLFSNLRSYRLTPTRPL